MGQAKSISRSTHHSASTPALSRESRVYTIGDLSREFDVSLRTLRFYEDRDLLHPERRGNARYYTPGDRVRLQIVLKGKKLGFTLTEIHEMLEADKGKDTAGLQLSMSSEQVRAQIDHLERQRGELDVAISELRATHMRLAALAGSIAA